MPAHSNSYDHKAHFNLCELEKRNFKALNSKWLVATFQATSNGFNTDNLQHINRWNANVPYNDITTK